MRRLIMICTTALFLLATSILATADDFHYLPKDLKVDEKIPTPKSHFGFRVGERHLQHHQLVSYLRKLAAVSPRVSLKVYAYTHGGRPSIMLTISSPENLKRLAGIQKAHRQLANPAKSSEVEVKNLPAIINMGYGVHGDESSASNSSAVVAYYLAAAQGKEIDRILNNCVVLLDPSLNPDGFNRFASWANGHVGRIQNPDPNHAEHNQPFPGGRVNYYWFDLNRDWLPAQHPESRGRLQQFHAWKPNVVLDFHEMGTNSTYFFQPGIPARNNPLTPKKNFELTAEMSLYHAKALDKIGSLYMTEEGFDDFYMGKGSTYPDLHGSVGILFEQASSRGHRQDSPNGELTFPFTIRNHVTTSLSSLAATVDMKDRLISFKRDFYVESVELSKHAEFKFLEFRSDGDASRLNYFAEVLLRHDINVFEKVVDGHAVLVVPARQPEYRFLLSLIEKRTDFTENIFYDVSTWHLPSAFGVQMESFETGFSPDGLKRLTLESVTKSAEKREVADALAYLVDWRSYDAPELVGQLLQSGIKVRIAQKAFSILNDGKQVKMPHGTVLIPVGIQKEKLPKIKELLASTAVPVHSVQTGLTPVGIDLGSRQFAAIECPKVAMLIGSGVSRYEAGEVWHLFDTRLKMPLSMLDTANFGRVNLARYNTIVMVSGGYQSLSLGSAAKLKDWVSNGGNLVLIGSSVSWAKANGMMNVEFVTNANIGNDPLKDLVKNPAKETMKKETPIQLPFDTARSTAALKLISGAIFETKVDNTHPIGYGFSEKTLPVFRNNKVIVKPSTNPYSNPIVYTADPQVAGYCSAENVDLLRNSAGVIATGSGRGTVIVIPQNPNFRAFWYGSNRIMFNSIFFGSLSN